MHHKPHLREVEEEELEEAEKDARVDGYINPLPASNDLVLQIYGNMLIVIGIISFVWLMVLIPLIMDKLKSPVIFIISAGVVVVMTAIIGVRIERENTAILPTFILLLLIFAAIAWFCIINHYYLASNILIFLVITGILASVRLYKTAIKDK
ncbi:MAG: hypothetical protein WCO98_13830 [bacterium]